jgi:adenosylhomocysteinase
MVTISWGTIEAMPPFWFMKADSKVKDMGLAEFGRKELNLAEHVMPSLMASRAEFGPSQTFKGLIIKGSSTKRFQTGLLIETRSALIATVRWASCIIFSTQSQATAAINKADTATVLAWKSETLPKYWWCAEQMMKVQGADGSNQLGDDGGDATLLVHKGKYLQEKFARVGSLPEPRSTDSVVCKCVRQTLRDSIQAMPQRVRGALEHAGIGQIEGVALRLEQAPGVLRLFNAGGRQVHIGPAGDSVFKVPGGLAVTDKH